MKISVLLDGEGKSQGIPTILLDTLLERGKVKAFRRSTGWVYVGLDPVRGKGGDAYFGPERRTKRNKSCIRCPEMVHGKCVSTVCPDRFKKTQSSTSFEQPRIPRSNRRTAPLCLTPLHCPKCEAGE